MLLATATDWVTRLTAAHRAGRLSNELARLRRYGLIIVDECRLPALRARHREPVLQLVSSHYEHASLHVLLAPHTDERRTTSSDGVDVLLTATTSCTIPGLAG